MTKIDLINKYSLALVTLILFILPIYTVNGSIDERCISQENSDYERIYCEVVSRGEGKGLPHFEDFKQNDVLVQKLLLKRPAAKLKIKLPPHKQTPKKASLAKTTTPKRTITQPNIVHNNDVASLSILSPFSLKQCSLTREKIVCGKINFIMKKNQSNSTLLPNVLDESYSMNLPEYSGNKHDSLEIQYYLSNAYVVYIRKMLDIGLGASTMSYTRFFHIYHDLQAKNVSFSDRFETMYSYLKKDKKSMTVKAVLSDKRPEQLSQCDDINEQIIACDGDGVNWIYVN